MSGRSDGRDDADERWVETRLRQLQESHPSRPAKPIGQILRRLLARRGYAQPVAAAELRAAWVEAVGEVLASWTVVGKLSGGVLTVWVADSAVLQELAFRKRQIMAKIKYRAPQFSLRDIVFRIGRVSEQ